jgi:hypothetical protein
VALLRSHEPDAAVAVLGVVPGDEGLHPLPRFVQTLEGSFRPGRGPTCQRVTQQLPSVFIYKKWAGLLEPLNDP